MERGESFYNPYLNDIVENLESQGLAVESEGATAVFLDGVSVACFQNWPASQNSALITLLIPYFSYSTQIEMVLPCPCLFGNQMVVSIMQQQTSQLFVIELI